MIQDQMEILLEINGNLRRIADALERFNEAAIIKCDDESDCWVCIDVNVADLKKPYPDQEPEDET